MENYSMVESEEMEIDLLDLFAELLKKWKQILIVGIVLGLLAMSYALMFGAKKPKEVKPEQLERAINELSENDKLEVDALYSQKESYTKYKEQLQKYYSNYIFEDDEAMDYLIKIIRYNVTSSAAGSISIMSDFSLTPEIYEQIKLILSDGDEMTEVDVYKHVGIGYSGDGGSYFRNWGEREDLIDNQGVLSVTIIAKNEGQCSRIQQIIDAALHEQFKLAQKIDPALTLTYIGETYKDDVRGWTVSQQNNWFSQIQNVDEMVRNVETQIKALTTEQNDYYELLEKQNAEQAINPRGLSWKKFLVIGGAVGVLLTIMYYAIRYVFDGKVKTEGELTSMRVPVLNRIALKLAKNNWITRMVRKIRHIGEKDRAEEERMTSSDIALLAKKADAKSLYILRTSDNEEEIATAKTIQDQLMQEVPNCDVRVGNPLDNADELKAFGESGNIVLLVTVKEAKRSLVRKCLGLCARYKLPVFGAVTIERV